MVTIKFKKKDGTFDKVDLTLIQLKDAGTNIYSAPVPASVYISGGLTFELK